jgi:hypothetical protein
MMFRTAALAACILFGASTHTALAQTPAGSSSAQVQMTTHELVLRDGSRLFGAVESEDAVEVRFRTQAGVLVTAKRTEIASLKEITGTVVNGEFLRADPNATRLFFGPTGRSLKKGQVYFGVYEIFMPFVQVGITDRFSIGGGTPLIWGGGDWENPAWVTPKLQVFQTPTTQVSVGVFHAFNLDDEQGGVAYVTGTNGGAAGSVTIGGGLAYGSDGGRGGVLMVGAERSVRRHLKVITENYVWKGGDGIASAGVRLFGEHLSADFAMMVPIGVDGFFVLPMVNFVYVF